MLRCHIVQRQCIDSCHQTFIVFSANGSRYWKCKRVESCLTTVSTISCRTVQWPHGLRPVACWDCGFESHRQDGCLSLLSVVRQRYLRRADHLHRGVLPSVVCPTQCKYEASIIRPWPPRGCFAINNLYKCSLFIAVQKFRMLSCDFTLKQRTLFHLFTLNNSQGKKSFGSLFVNCLNKLYAVSAVVIIHAEV